jgi:hypothetical protein
MRLHIACFAALLVAGSPSAAAEDGTPIAFDRLATGTTPALRAKTDYVVARTPGEWTAAWRLPFTDSHGQLNGMGRDPSPPRVDLDARMVLGVVDVAHAESCSARVKIVGVIRSGAGIMVDWQGHRPRADEICLTAFFAPYDFVTVPRSDAAVTFRKVSATE